MDTLSRHPIATLAAVQPNVRWQSHAQTLNFRVQRSGRRQYVEDPVEAKQDQAEDEPAISDMPREQQRLSHAA
jgi:hypothetical protein